MNEFRADLHCHTTCSDGTFTPTELVRHACSLGLKGLSITDHDTISAYAEAAPIANDCLLPLISGVEFSTVHRQESVHVLAYSFSLNCPVITTFCETHKERRILRLHKILDLLAARGMPLSFEAPLNPSTYSVGRPHIAAAMVKQGYVKSIQQAFHEYIGEGKPCYVPSSGCSVEETLDIIRRANGIAVIAHPHLIHNTAILKDLLDMPFDGIEGYYARFSAKEQERWVKIGARKGWVITAGSDFHGTIKPNIPLGASWVTQETFSLLQHRFLENQEIDSSA